MFLRKMRRKTILLQELHISPDLAASDGKESSPENAPKNHSLAEAPRLNRYHLLALEADIEHISLPLKREGKLPQETHSRQELRNLQPFRFS
jgi:hypothetical protein